MDKKLTRISDGKMIAGVCTGLAKYLNMDVSLVRIIMVLLTVFTSTGLIIYLVVWLVAPEDKSGHTGVDDLKEQFGTKPQGQSYDTYQPPAEPQDPHGPQDPQGPSSET